MPYIHINDLDMYYEQLGFGEPVIFLHSHYSRGILAFASQILDFQQHYTCYYPDFRGHGRSICDSLEWSVPQLAEDVIAMMDLLHIDKAHLISYSMGGGVALHCAVRSPERFKTLTAIGCSGFADPTGADDYEPEQLIKNGQWEFIERMKANHAVAHKGNWQEFMRQTAKDWRAYPNLTEQQLSSIDCPSFFIAGEQDPYTTEEQIKRLCALVKDSRYLIVPGCSHRPHMLREEPRLVNDAILNFISTMGGK